MQRWLWPLRTEIPDLAGCCDSLRELAVPCQTALRFLSSLISDSTVTDHHGNEAMAQLHKGGELREGSSLCLFISPCVSV